MLTVIPFRNIDYPYHNKVPCPQTGLDVLANFESSGHFVGRQHKPCVVKSTLPALERKTFTNYMDGITFGIMFGLALYNTVSIYFSAG
jgi:hypothetical protein